MTGFSKSLARWRIWEDQPGYQIIRGKLVKGLPCLEGCGSEATVVRNVTVKNCRITRDATMLAFKLRPDTPQHCENILINGIPYQAPASVGP